MVPRMGRGDSPQRLFVWRASGLDLWALHIAEPHFGSDSPTLLEHTSRPVGKSGVLPAVLVKVARVEPGEERLAQRRPFAVDGGVPGGVPVTALVDRSLPEHPL